MGVTHAFSSAKSDGGDATLVRPSDWNAGHVITFVGAKAYHSTTQSVSNGVAVALLFDSEEFDTNGYHSTSSNTSRMTVPSALGGTYLLRAFAYDGNGANSLLRFIKNGTTYLRGTNVYSPLGHESVCLTQLSVSDYVEAEMVPGFTGNIGHASAPEAQDVFEFVFLGA